MADGRLVCGESFTDGYAPANRKLTAKSLRILGILPLHDCTQRLLLPFLTITLKHIFDSSTPVVHTTFFLCCSNLFHTLIVLQYRWQNNNATRRVGMEAFVKGY